MITSTTHEGAPMEATKFSKAKEELFALIAVQPSFPRRGARTAAAVFAFIVATVVVGVAYAIECQV